MTEVVFWKKYSIADGVIHNLSSNLGAGYVDNSGPAGLSQSLVDNYLNADGTPINPADGIFKDFNLTFKGIKIESDAGRGIFGREQTDSSSPLSD